MRLLLLSFVMEGKRENSTIMYYHKYQQGLRQTLNRNCMERLLDNFKKINIANLNKIVNAFSTTHGKYAYKIITDNY